MKLHILLMTLLSGLLVASIAEAYDGKIIDAKTKAPIAGAVVTVNNEFVRTKADGTFHLEGTGDVLKVRAPGYKKQEVATSTTEIALTPFKVKALYLSSYGIASSTLRNGALETLKKNNMNALVIDMKGDRSFIPFKVNIPLAQEIGAQDHIFIKEPAAFIAGLKEKNIYLIARIVVFKDDLLAEANPGWVVRKNGGVFRDKENLRWLDPFKQEVWAYNIAIAKAAAELGFDEVQFDYVRFPDTKGIQFSKPSNKTTRTEAITGFLNTAYKALAPYNVMVAADIFGYVPWNTDDTGIGQDINKVTNSVDVVSLMLYPSGFQFGIPKYVNPIQHPYEIVHLSLKRAQERTNMSARHFRPWLQAFRDYAFHGGDFSAERMRTQAKAADDAGSSGYMFWNPRNVYAQAEFDS
jgi:hypothetical protein